MDPVEQLLVEFYNVPPEKAKYLARDIASKQALGDVGMSGGISRDSMYSAVRDSAADPSRVALPMSYQDQLPAFADAAARPYQRQLDQALMNARGAMQETTNIALNGGRTPSQAMQQAPSDQRAYQAGSVVLTSAQGAAQGGREPRFMPNGNSVGAVGRYYAGNGVRNASYQQTYGTADEIMPNGYPAWFNSAVNEQIASPALRKGAEGAGKGAGQARPVPAPASGVSGPDFSAKYAKYRDFMVQQDPQNGQNTFDMRLEQRRQVLLQELQAIEGHRNGKSAAMAGASSAMRASDELRKQANYISSPLYGVSSREAYDRATDSDKDGD